MVRSLPKGAPWVVATHNAGKAREMRALLGELASTVETATELGLTDVVEDGATFEENAALKARAAAVAAGRVALADDSGLVVPALDGAPGLLSARWAGQPRDFARAMARVHEALGDAPRSATMVCALAIAWPDGHVETYEGRVDGTLVWPPRGAHGFGYEPMFVPLGASRTYGEMERADKHADDPRARAFARLLAAPRGER